MSIKTTVYNGPKGLTTAPKRCYLYQTNNNKPKQQPTNKQKTEPGDRTTTGPHKPPNTMKKTNQTEKQIAALLEKAGRTSDNNTPTTVIIADRGGETIPQAYGFFTREAAISPQGCDDRNEPGAWNYSDEEEPNQIHIWMMDDDPDTRKEARTTDQDPQVLQDELTRTRENLAYLESLRLSAIKVIDQQKEAEKGLIAQRDRMLTLIMPALKNGYVAEADLREIYENDEITAAKLRADIPLTQEEKHEIAEWIEATVEACRDHFVNKWEKPGSSLDDKAKHQDDKTPPTQEEIDQAQAERDSLQIACTILRAELNRTKEILTQTKAERDQARTELEATIESHQEKPITLNVRETQILDALVEAGAIKQAKKLFYARDVIQAKLQTRTELDATEREALLGLVRDANENEIPWTNDEIPL